MAPLKAVPSLFDSSMKLVISSLKAASFKVSFEDYGTAKVSQVQTYFDGIPVIIQDKLVAELLEIGYTNESLVPFTLETLVNEAS